MVRTLERWFPAFPRRSAILTDLDPAASLQVQDILFQQALLGCASNIPRVDYAAVYLYITRCR